MADAAKKPGLPLWDDNQTEEQLERAHQRALGVFNAHKDQFCGLEKGTIVLVDGNGDITVSRPLEDIVAVSQRHYQTYKGSFDDVFEFRIE
jgi:hypothetical protein